MTLPLLKAEKDVTKVYPEDLTKRQAKAAFHWKDAEGRGLYLSISPWAVKHLLLWVMHPGGTWDSAASSAERAQVSPYPSKVTPRPWQHTATCQFMVQRITLGWGGFFRPLFCSTELQLSVLPLNQRSASPWDVVGYLHCGTDVPSVTSHITLQSQHLVPLNEIEILLLVPVGLVTHLFILHFFFSTENKSHSYDWVTCLN